ncbi:deoxyribose-phosphate aldolase [Candidatus Aerophobetes bacterium]|uniref:Deoxyribose-phosphate aldolase n=1 Tax=Aerophobetes bacterium TaxID=2030807 RepID=A0A2A4YID7_UNCAE|nr:MAG: deoxyribose-phosphate aldolase [Candidatus Aerophobetes bacterium]
MELATYIDHTLLNTSATKEEIESFCNSAKDYPFASVFVHPYHVSFAKELLESTNVPIGTTVGFPLGSNTPDVKIYEAKNALDNGAGELDMVLNLPAFFSLDFETVSKEIREIKKLLGDRILKVIIETCLLDDEQKILACQLVADAGADFVKTSTGCSTSGAKVSDVSLMHKACGTRCRVKASGGIRDKESALLMIEAGASRIGTSSSTKIMLS